MTKLIDRYTGAMLGGLVGDCLGAHFEMRYQNLVPLKKIETFLEEVKNLDPVNDDKFQYTDDSAMARQIALGFIEKEELDAKFLAKRFSKEYFHEPWRGYGGSVVEVFKKLRDSGCEYPHKPASEQFDGSGSYGNGAGMRAHPVALACFKEEEKEVVEQARKVAKITHGHPLGVNGGILQTLAVYYALHSNDSSKILQNIKRAASELEESYKCSTASTYKNKIDLIEQSLDKSMDDLDEICFELGNDVSAVDSVPTALFCFLKVLHDAKKEDPVPEDIFERVLKLSIRMGGDTDTIASMACSITGAYLGRQKIPNTYVDVCENSTEVENMGSQIFNLLNIETENNTNKNEKNNHEDDSNHQPPSKMVKLSDE